MQRRLASRLRGRRGLALFRWLLLAGAASSVVRLLRGGPTARQAANPLDATAVTLPVFFDSSAYLFFNPDLGPLSHAQAAAHYLAAGRAEGRLARRLSLYVSYRADFGLCNQLFQHIRASCSTAQALQPEPAGNSACERRRRLL